jgi:chemotaxis response regulator CheB
MGEKQRIIIAEDHTILREGLRALISSNPDLEVVGEAEDGREAIRCVENLMPDLILIDLSMPRMNGMEAIKDIKRRRPETRVLALTVHRTEEYILATLRAGANGYVLKDATHACLNGEDLSQSWSFGKGDRGILRRAKNLEIQHSMGYPHPARARGPEVDCRRV